MKYAEPKPEVRPDSSAIDTQLVENLAQLVTRLGLSELEVKKDDFKVRIARQLSVPVAQTHVAPPQPAATGAAQKAAAEADGPGTVKSPMVGTAYLRSSPDAAPFVEVVARVKTGDK